MGQGEPKSNTPAPWWLRWGICVMGAIGLAHLAVWAVALIHFIPPAWSTPVALLAAVGVSAALFKPWRADF